MKTPLHPAVKTLRSFVFVIVTCAATQLARGQSLWNAVINVSADTNWSAAVNWTPNGAPTGVVVFDDTTGVGALDPTINSAVNSGFGGTITSLVFTNRTTQQNVLIADGVTLHLNGSLLATNGSVTSAMTPISTISGANGAALVVNNASANVFVGIYGTTTTGPQQLDLSGLDIFTFTGAKMMAGVGTVSSTPRDSGILSLAKTNRITLTGASPQVDIGHNSQNTGNASTLNLGQTNTIFADNYSVGLDKQGGNGTIGSMIRFNPVFTANPFAYFRGHDGVSPVNSWGVADGLGNTGSSVAPRGTIDFTGGTVDARVTSIWLAKPSPSSPGSPNAVATLTFEAGVINVDNLTNAWALTGSGGTPTATGTLNVNSNLNGAATLIVNNNLVIAFKSGSGNSTGTLNVNGGTVQANTIVAGGGNSTINLNSGTLIVTNTAGTPSASLGTLLLAGTADATLQLSVAGAVAEINTTNLAVNGAVTVNIASLPIITSYPKQFPLIGYASFPGTFNFALGTLPAGSPAFQGYISNNVTGNSIDLVLTNGPIANTIFQWTGAANNNWDLTNVNWKLGSTPLTYSNTSLVLFDDTTTVTNVTLAQTLSPGSVTVSNNANAYTFAGPGALVGSGGLTKSGSSTLVVANSGANQFSGGIVINGGTLQFGNGGANGNIPSGDAVSDSGSLAFNLSGNASLFGIVSGSGSLVQNGSGVISLIASNTYTGPTTINSGTLLVDGAISGGGSVNNTTGSTLGGNGTITGAINAGGQINPGDVNAIGTLNANGNVTLASGASLKFDLNSADPTQGTGINDLLQVGGNLTLNNNTLNINIRGIPSPGFNYPVVSYIGALSGSFNPTVGGTHYTAAVDTTTPNIIFVDITGSTGANLKWNSTSSGVWDTGTSNWFNIDTAHADFFGGGDSVLFDDSVVGAQTNITIVTGDVVAPLTITNTGAYNYTISGGGTISGAATLIKDGSGTLTINTTNGFTGGTVIVNGTLVIGSVTALGPALAATSITVSNTGTLDLNGTVVQNQHAFLSGVGVGGNGVVVNGSTGAATLQLVTLNGDATFGGTNDWRVANQTTGHATMNTAGLPVNITKTGPNQFLILGTDTTDPNIENLNVLQGTVTIQGSTPQPSSQFGDPNGIITVSSNASFAEVSITAPIAKNIVLNDGGIFWSAGGSSTNTGTVILTNNTANTAPGTGIITNNSGSTLVLQSVIAGPGNLLNTGSGTTLIENFNTYTGNTTVNAGTLALDDLGSITNTPAITLASGGRLNVSARTDGTLELISGQTLKGSGTVQGNLAVDAGATIAPGGATVGTLTVTNALTLAGTTVMKVDGNTATNDLINVAQTITNGGTLTVSILNPPIGGQTFKLFNALAFTGAFAQTNLPGLSAGLSWNTANLGVNGSISITGTAAGPTTNASITKVSFSNGNLIVHGTNNNVPNTSFRYVVLSSTNIALPLTNWTPVLTNMFNSDGTFDYTNAVVPGTARQFIDVKAVP